jgi:nicotinamide riboside kinase
MNDIHLKIARGTRSTPDDALIINLFGGPGIGKTTLAAQVFAGLKTLDVEAACPTEHAKLALWQGREELLDNQLILLGRTWDTVSTLSKKVQVIILDSPILLISHYGADREPQCFHEAVGHYHQRHDRINVLLTRNDDLQYVPTGRRETPDRAKVIDREISSMLERYSEPYARAMVGSSCAQTLVDKILVELLRRK